MAGGKFYKINHYIRADQVRVIDKQGRQIGVMPLSEALNKARKENLDLVEVAPKAQPPVCRIIDFRRFLYQQKKKQKSNRVKKKKQTEFKQIRLKIFIDDHDLQRKVKDALTFLKNGARVKFIIIFRGREITKKELGYGLLAKIKKALAEKASVAQKERLKGKILEMTFKPIKNGETKNEKVG